MQNANMLIDLHLLPREFEFICDTYKLTKELRKNRDSNRLWYCADRLDIPASKLDAWRDVLRASNLTAKEIVVDGEPRKVLDSKAWDGFYEKTMSQLKTFISTHQKTLLDRLNNRLFNMEYEKYCAGDVQQWELDSMNFYFSGHPLNKVLPQLPYPTDRIENIVEGMQEGQFVIKGKAIPRMKLFTIAGTVIDKDKVKGLVTLQTPSGVVNLKIYKDLFSTFIATIGDIDENGEKEIEQDSFFEKGTHLLVTGIQRGATFVPKVYTKTGRKSILKIVLDEDGDFVELEEKMDV
jgi:DNA polymerase-3 subunit alpha